MLTLTRCSRTGYILGPAAFRIRDVIPSVPDEVDDLKSRIVVTSSMSESSRSSKTGGLHVIGDGLSFRGGIFYARLLPISAKKSFKVFAIISGSLSSLMCVIFELFDI